MPQLFNAPRQDATLSGPSNVPLDISNYTYSVADAVLAFREASMSITERTVQRYCQSGKVRALKVNPDTRQPTDKDNYLFLIDPSSIPERVAQLREKQEFVSPTIVASSRDITRQVATSHDMSEHVAPVVETPKTNTQSREEQEEMRKLKEELMSLEIDKRVRDGLLDQMKQDRKELLLQLQHHVETMTNQSRVIGRLETRLELSAPEPSKDTEEEFIQAPVNPDETVMPLQNHQGDNTQIGTPYYGV